MFSYHFDSTQILWVPHRGTFWSRDCFTFFCSWAQLWIAALLLFSLKRAGQNCGKEVTEYIRVITPEEMDWNSWYITVSLVELMLFSTELKDNVLSKRDLREMLNCRHGVQVCYCQCYWHWPLDFVGRLAVFLGKLFRGFPGLENTDGFFKYINNKRKTKGDVNVLLNGGGTVVKEDAEKAELLNCLLCISLHWQHQPSGIWLRRPENLTQE